jgi:hypothetical protein
MRIAECVVRIANCGLSETERMPQIERSEHVLLLFPSGTRGRGSGLPLVLTRSSPRRFRRLKTFFLRL